MSKDYSEGPPATSMMLVQQAAAIVGGVIQAEVAEAVRTADACRCDACQRRLAETVVWALGMLDDPLPGGPGGR